MPVGATTSNNSSAGGVPLRPAVHGALTHARTFPEELCHSYHRKWFKVLVRKG